MPETSKTANHRTYILSETPVLGPCTSKICFFFVHGHAARSMRKIIFLSGDSAIGKSNITALGQIYST